MKTVSSIGDTVTLISRLEIDKEAKKTNSDRNKNKISTIYP